MTHIDNIRALGNRIVTNLNTMGVSASFSDGALTLADKILDIESTDLSNVLLLYADKKIISKDETLELYSLYLEDGLPVSNETITFTVKDKNDTIVETLTGTTNTDGIANVSYLGKGTGDINIQASTNNSIILSKTYSIKDAIKYISDTLTSSQTISTDLPTNFKCKFKAKVVDTSGINNAWLEVGSNNDNCLLFGNTGSYKTIGIFVKVNGSYVVNDSRNDVLPVNEWTELTYSYNNGVHTLTDGNNTLTLNNSQITARDYVYFRNETNQIKEILFLPL